MLHMYEYLNFMTLGIQGFDAAKRQRHPNSLIRKKSKVHMYIKFKQLTAQFYRFNDSFILFLNESGIMFDVQAMLLL